ncbi:hypothetical protein ccbrp13_61080 [Ktedonobacteria bacterium brp13]|nr:hypothetical protein ccbrp13_61080 [Ktedonobacteria bacterium brp13]
MKSITMVRRAAHLMAHIEDLKGLGKLNAQDVHVLQDALLLLIGQIQQDCAKDQTDLLVSLPLPFPTKTYEFQQRNSAPNSIIVYEAGFSERRLKHVPIFSYGFGLTDLPAFDAALAILADFFGEDLSMRAFARGQGHACSYYRAFAKEILPHGHVETKHIIAFLQRGDFCFEK